MIISVVAPSYNRCNILRDAVESIMGQKLHKDYELEIIVVDDHSDVQATKTLSLYLPRVKIIRNKKNFGVSAARNIGIKASKGEYIAFLDSDDLWLPEKTHCQIKFMSENNYKVSHTDEFWFREDRFVNSGKQHQKFGGDIFINILDKCRVSPSSLIVKREVFDEVGYFDEKLRVCEDYELMLRIASIMPVGYLDQKNIIKRAVCSNSLSLNLKHIESVRTVILKNFIATHDLPKEYKIHAEQELARKQRIVGNKI